MSQGESRLNYQIGAVVYKDVHGRSWFFEPKQLDEIGRHSESFGCEQVLYRHKQDPSIWFVLERNYRVHFHQTTQPPTGRFLSQDTAIDWILDRQAPIPPDVDIQERYLLPSGSRIDGVKDTTDTTMSGTTKRPRLKRNLQWHIWHYDATAETYRSHAKIRDKWNVENPRDRIDLGKSDAGRGVVKQGIRAASKYLKERGIDAKTALAELESRQK